MKQAYPIVIEETNDKEVPYLVFIPDFDISTQGSTIVEAIEMARDAIGIIGIDFEDDKKDLPKPYSKNIESNKKDIVTLVDVDFTDYRRKLENKAVKKTLTIPYWMNEAAEKEGINFSRTLQEALERELKKA